VQIAQQMSIFRGIAEVLNRSFTLREALDAALYRIVELLGVRSGWIFLTEPETEQLRIAADVRLPQALSVAGKRRMAGDCRCIQMLRNGELTEPVNFVPCARLEQVLPQATESHRHASVPLIAQDEAVGILNLWLPPGREFTHEELSMLEVIAHELAVTIQRARLFDKVRHQEKILRDLLQRLMLAQEAERRRIAQDLHDHAGQMMTAIIIQLAQMATRAEERQDANAAALRRLHDIAQQGLDDLRALVHELRPSVLDDLGLVPAVRSYVDRVVKPAGIEVDLHLLEMAHRLPAEIETVAFRILQEAVTNTLRHARARRVEVRLDRRDRMLIVMIRDDGVGFDPEAPGIGRGSLGLHGMRERAQLIGGTLQIMAVPGVGTTVVARIPLPEDPHQPKGPSRLEAP